MHHEVFARGLDIEQNDLLEIIGQETVLRVGRFFMQHQGMVELRHDVAHGDLFDFPEIHHQSQFGMSRLIIDLSGHRNMQLVGVAMDVLARTIVAV